MNVEDVIGAELIKQARVAGGDPTTPLAPETRLVDTGLDSLGFTTLLIELQRKLGVDPFDRDDEIIYPESFAELVELYRHSLSAQA